MSDPLNRLPEGRKTNEPEFERLLARKVHQDKPNKNGENALARHDEHDETRDNQEGTKKAFEEFDQDSPDGVPCLNGFRDGSMLQKIVRRHPPNQYRDQ